jgi:hypothetical protein
MTKSQRTDRQQRERERYLLYLEFEWLYDTALMLLAEHDPIGIAFHPSEYDPEVRTILPRLGEAATVEDLTRILYEEFVRWFSPHTAGPLSRYRPIAEDLWEAYLRWSDTRG